MGIVSTYSVLPRIAWGLIWSYSERYFDSGSASIQEKLAMIAAGDPGTTEMPDIATCYPHTAILLADNNLLALLDEQFTQKELSAYLPPFVEEGRLSDGKLHVFPIAKASVRPIFMPHVLRF